MESEKFCLRWNDFESNISSAFSNLRDGKDFFDVTLACDDEQIQAHKVILSACSPFFHNILRHHTHQHPLLYLKGVKFTELQSVLNFMYQGEVNVAQEELNSFLAVAEDLKVKGLTQNQAGSAEKERHSLSKSSQNVHPIQKDSERKAISPKKRIHPTLKSTNISKDIINDEDIQEIAPIKTEIQETSDPPSEQSYPSHPSTGHPARATALAVEVQGKEYEDYQEYEDFGEYSGGQDTIEEGQGADGTIGKKFSI